MTDGERAYRNLEPRAYRPRYQRFIDLVAQGWPQGRAWTKAGFDSDGAAAKAAASRWLSKGNHQAALDWRRAQAIEHSGLTIDEWWQKAAALLRSDPLYLELWAEGAVKLADLTPEERAGVTAVTVKESGERSIKATSPLDVMKTIAAPLGITTQRIEVTPDKALAELSQLTGLSPEEIEAATKGEES